MTALRITASVLYYSPAVKNTQQSSSMFLKTMCTRCGKSSTVKVNSKVGFKNADDAFRNKRLWETRDCSHCRGFGTLIPLPDTLLGRKKITTKARDPLHVQMKGLRRPSTRVRKPRSRFTEIEEMAEESDFDDEVLMDEEEEILEDEDEGEYKEETGGAGFAGTIGRLNTEAYPSSYLKLPPGLPGLKVYTIPPDIKPVSKGSRIGTQGKTMGQHYVYVGPASGPLAKKTFVANLKSKNGTLSATSYGNFFAKRVKDGPKFKQVSKRNRENRHSTFEWCHGLACSLGGSNSYENLYAASFDANTFSCVIEDWLRKHINHVTIWIQIRLYYDERTGVETSKSKRTSARRAPAFFSYGLYTSQKLENELKFYVDCRCQGFNGSDRTAIINKLDSHFKIPMDLR